MKTNHDEIDVRELFIEELGEVTGGVMPAVWRGGEKPPVTTMAYGGAEGPAEPPVITTLRTGEEGAVQSTFDVAPLNAAWSNAGAWAKLVR